MASGSSGPVSNSVSKGFDFAASDDFLCSYVDYSNHASSAQEFHKSRMTRSSMYAAPSYRLPEESSFNEDVMTTVDKTMKKYADNLMCFLEGISSRLSQLESYCYNLDKSIGEVQSDLIRDHRASDSKLRSLENDILEVHRSLQIIRDKQELAEAQKELAKIRLAHKENNSRPISDTKRSGNYSEVNGQELAPAPLPISSQSQGYYVPQGNRYVIYDGREGGKGYSNSTPQPHFPEGGYSPSRFTVQNQQPASRTTCAVAHPTQLIRNHPYNELIEKFVNLGYRGDHVINVIQRLEESGQPVDFNTVLWMTRETCNH